MDLVLAEVTHQKPHHPGIYLSSGYGHCQDPGRRTQLGSTARNPIEGLDAHRQTEVNRADLEVQEVAPEVLIG